ncbi:MAG: S1 RNA-binding domain-containing protein [Thermoanaerobaculia bacterium]
MAEVTEVTEVAEVPETPSTPETAPSASVAAAAGAEGTPVAAAPEAGVATPAAPAAAKSRGEGGAPREKKAGARPKGDKVDRKPRDKRHRPTGKSVDEFVAPTPEELALVPSDLVRTAIANQAYVEGKVIGWNQGGFHVVVDGITSFCPRSSMELGAPKEPAQYLDQSFLFRVLRVEEKGHRLVVSHAAVLRDEKAHKTAESRAALTLGSTVTGKVISLTDFGAFVDLGGIEGLIHVSEIKRSRVEHPNEVLKVGDEVTAKIIKLPKGGDRVSLSMKALEPDPWQSVSSQFANGDKFTGKVMRKSEFGWFVEVAPGVEGLLHVSQLAPGMKAEDPKLAPGEMLEGWVREVDLARKRISLALRETPQGNPWEGVETRYAEGAKVIGTVEKVEKFGAFILLEPGLTGLLPASEMGLPKGANVGRTYGIGKKVTLQVAQVDTRKKRISLTIEGKTLEGSKSDYQSFLKQAKKSTGMGALAAALQRLQKDAD